jgi:two-component system LytT family sensor kinase
VNIRFESARFVRRGALVFALWFAFFVLLGAMQVVRTPQTADSLLRMLAMNAILGVLWTVLSAGIAAWHRRARAIAPNAWALVAMHVPTLILAALIDTLVSRYGSILIVHTRNVGSVSAMLTFFADFDIVTYLAVVAVAEALLVRRALAERQQLAKRLESSLSRARLDYLEAQLQPHFLFNSLGAVSELAYDAPLTAARVLRQLTSIFRTALARKADEVTFGEEIVGVEPYLDIQRIRFADWLTIDYDVDDAAVDCLLPRFVLQPLIENAIRHGLSGRSAAGSIVICAAVETDSLIVRVTDNGVGLESTSPASGRGIGLNNVRDRLAILYGDDDRLQLTANATGGASAELRIPARRRRDIAFDSPVESTPTVSIGTTDLRVFAAPRFLRHPAVAIPVAWFFWGLLWTQQSVISDLVHNRIGERTWLQIARGDMTSAAIWALLTVPILFLARRFPLRSEHLAPRVAAYFAFGLAAPLAHIALLHRFAYPRIPVSSPIWQMPMAVDFLIFCILVAVGHRHVLASWLRAREEAADALTAELAAAQTRATKLQGIPRVLLHSLDGIAETVRRDPSLTERQLTRLADYLRLALESTDERGMTPDREHALEAAVAALRDSGAYTLDLTLTA